MPAPLKATFFAFRRRGRAGVLTGVTLTHVVLMLALFGLLAALNAELLWTAALGGIEDGTVAPLSVLGIVSVAWLLYSLIMASYEAALLRWMIRGDTAGFGGFSFGGDTWRVYLGYWIWALVSLVLGVLTFVLATIVIAALGYAERVGTDEEAVWGALLTFGAWGLVTAPLALRMCSGNAASVARQKFSYFESWRVSRDRTRALLGSFLLLWPLWIAVEFAIFMGGALAAGAIYVNSTGNETDGIMWIALIGSFFVANLLMTFLSAGVNARAVLAAIEDGKLEGLTPDLANVFD